MKLKKRYADKAENQTQRVLHFAAENCLGTLTSGNSGRAETSRKTVRRRLKRNERSISG